MSGWESGMCTAAVTVVATAVATTPALLRDRRRLRFPFNYQLFPFPAALLRCSCLDLATPTSRPRHHTTPGPWVAEQLHTLNDFRRTKAKTEANAGVAVDAEGSTDTSTDFKDGIVVVRYLLGTVGFDESGESQWSVVRGQGYDQCRGRGQGYSVWSVPNSNL